MRFLLGTVNKPRLTSLAALATLAVLSVLVVYQQCSCESLCLCARVCVDSLFVRDDPELLRFA